MARRRPLATLLPLAACALLGGMAVHGAVPEAEAEAAPASRHSLLVEFDEGRSHAWTAREVARARRALGGRGSVSEVGYGWWTVPAGRSRSRPASARRALLRAGIRFHRVQPLLRGERAAMPATAPNDPLFAQQWALENSGSTLDPPPDIRALRGWGLFDEVAGQESVDPGPTVAVIDDGLATYHEDLAPSLLMTEGQVASARLVPAYRDYADALRKEYGDREGLPSFDASDPITSVAAFLKGQKHGVATGLRNLAVKRFEKQESYQELDLDSVTVGAIPSDVDDGPVGDPSKRSVYASDGHGTGVAGVVAAARGNGIGISGVAPSAELLSIAVTPDAVTDFIFSASGLRPGVGQLAVQIPKAVALAAESKARVVNMSLSATPSEPYGDPASSPICEALVEAPGVLAVTSAGNNSLNNDTNQAFPRSCPGNVITVAATDRTGALAPYSNYGATSVDLAAPGGAGSASPAEQQVLTTAPNAFGTEGQGTYRAVSGTSFAAPMVTGIAAAILGLYPDATPQDLRDAITTGVTRITDEGSLGKTRTDGIANLEGAIAAYREIRGRTQPKPDEPQIVAPQQGEQIAIPSGKAVQETLTWEHPTGDQALHSFIVCQKVGGVSGEVEEIPADPSKPVGNYDLESVSDTGLQVPHPKKDDPCAGGPGTATGGGTGKGGGSGDPGGGSGEGATEHERGSHALAGDGPHLTQTLWVIATNGAGGMSASSPVTITYGAGGSTRSGTVSLGEWIEDVVSGE